MNKDNSFEIKYKIIKWNLDNLFNPCFENISVAKNMLTNPTTTIAYSINESIGKTLKKR